MRADDPRVTTGPGSTGILVAFLLVVALSLTGCGGGEPGPTAAKPDASSSTAPLPAPSLTPIPRPRRGECHRLSRADALAPTNDAPAVTCAQPHTSQTFHAGRLDLRNDGHPLQIDSPAAQREVERRCRAQFDAFVGGDPRISVLSPVWFGPTLEEADAGADWFRCDVVALAGPGQLANLPRNARGVLDTEAGADRFGLCGTKAPDQASFTAVSCGSPHSWRALRAVDLPGPTFPTAEEAAAVMQGPCADAAREVATDPLNVTWTEARPTKQQWRSGRRHGLCWAPV